MVRRPEISRESCRCVGVGIEGVCQQCSGVAAGLRGPVSRLHERCVSSIFLLNIESCCCLFSGLACSGDAWAVEDRTSASRADVVDAVVAVMQAHVIDSGVSEQACKALGIIDYYG